MYLSLHSGYIGFLSLVLFAYSILSVLQIKSFGDGVPLVGTHPTSAGEP